MCKSMTIGRQSTLSLQVSWIAAPGRREFAEVPDQGQTNALPNRTMETIFGPLHLQASGKVDCRGIRVHRQSSCRDTCTKNFQGYKKNTSSTLSLKCSH